MIDIIIQNLEKTFLLDLTSSNSGEIVLTHNGCDYCDVGYNFKLLLTDKLLKQASNGGLNILLFSRILELVMSHKIDEFDIEIVQEIVVTMSNEKLTQIFNETKSVEREVFKSTIQFNSCVGLCEKDTLKLSLYTLKGKFLTYLVYDGELKFTSLDVQAVHKNVGYPALKHAIRYLASIDYNTARVCLRSLLRYNIYSYLEYKAAVEASDVNVQKAVLVILADWGIYRPNYFKPGTRYTLVKPAFGLAKNTTMQLENYVGVDISVNTGLGRMQISTVLLTMLIESGNLIVH